MKETMEKKLPLYKMNPYDYIKNFSVIRKVQEALLVDYIYKTRN